MWLALLLLLCLSPVTPKQKTGSCSQPHSLCCFGTDHRCRRGSCYCDEFCHVVPDCCPDYGSLCNPGTLHPGSLPSIAEWDAVIDRGESLACALGHGWDVNWLAPKTPSHLEFLALLSILC
ncbi:somatomedin-B and thrombospondin type-1 domain-containing protein-like [Perognathus longimembris pacificus]|uniref:somatomedin-B and thrombospondin type-1 domain-containing protein-like n=1 Tax=Perognathus longimembris pacificus TaxID=214514 RepID=UPI002019DBFF|nr:somatomedin-B and thrombospondin type-1 domain-containing protein-like [Perognathus longimembris pacificus]